MCVGKYKYMPFVHLFLYAHVCGKILEARLSLHQNNSVLNGNKGEDRSLWQTTLTAFSII